MMRRAVMRGAMIAASVLVPLAALSSSPAHAGSVTGCTGANCSVSLSQFIHYKGSPPITYDPSGGNAIPINEDPPPCLWDPIGDATTGSNYIIQQFPNPAPDLPFDIPAAVTKAKALLKNPVPGTWYNLPINPAADEAGQQACLKLPAFFFAVPGATPPMPPIPAKILAEYAYNHMRVPAPKLTISPAGQGWVNLATFVWTNTPGQVSVTARLGPQTVTVTARSAKTVITASDAGTVSDDCTVDGSKYPQGHPPDTGPGTAPDCGVLWHNSATAATVGATVTWNVTYTPDNAPLPNITLGRTAPAMPIAEIQSVNGN
jgi:hypothetical protein